MPTVVLGNRWLQIMESFEISKTKKGFHIEGFPQAVKVLSLDSPMAQRLADLALHRADLDFALECLTYINNAPEEPHVLRQALWRSAIVHHMKCFGRNNSRFSLDQKRIYGSDDGARAAFGYFDSLRNKHLVHDENSYAQCLPGAVLNKRDMDHKIAKIVCLSVIGDTLTQPNYNNLHLLVTKARTWVVGQFDDLCNALTSQLEPRSYDELLSMKEITYMVPDAEAVHRARKQAK